MPRVNGTSAPHDTIVASAPGRICLFGEHQDYLGLPVIAAAIDLRVTVTATPAEHHRLRVDLPDVDSRFEIDPNVENVYTNERDYLVAAVNVLRRQGLIWRHGYDVVVRGSIPINSGASSSSALLVAWAAFLLKAAGDDRAHLPEAIARIAHQAEVAEFNAPGGMMDHFACSVGGAIWLDTRAPYRVEALPDWPGEFLLVDSGIPKDTNGVLGETRRRVEALHLPYDRLPMSPGDVPLSFIETIRPQDRSLYEATIVNRHITERAKHLLIESRDAKALGDLLNDHHHQLANHLGTSLPAIDEMLRFGRQQGALGGKINGSGCGGSFFLLCPGRGAEMQELYRLRGLKSHIIRIGGGVQVSNHRSLEVASL
jgi:galactokinase